MIIPEVLRRPLVFGDRAQIQALQDLEERLDLCEECDGEGTVQCSMCRGDGKKHE